MSTLRTRVRLLFSTLAQMTGANPVLLEGEQWTEKDADTGQSTGRRKVGDGVTAFNSLGFEPGGSGGGGDATDLSITSRGATTLVVASSTGADATVPAATTSLTGLLTAADKTKLDGIATGATANATDAQLRDRATHTGTQAAGTITGLATVATSGAYADLSGRPTLGGAAALNVGTSAGTVAAGDDARLSDARTPTAHSQAWSTLTGTPTTLSGYGISDAQPLDADLTSIAALNTTSFGRGHLALTDAAAATAQLDAFTTTVKGLVPAPGTATGKVLSDSGLWVALGGGGDALVANPLSQFAATSSDQLRGVISDESGTGAVVFANSPTLITPALGTPSALTLTHATGLPIATGVSGLGTGIATALGVNVGSAGAPVLFGGAGGTPSSLTLTNASGLPTSGITAFNADTRAQVESALVAGSNISITPGSSGATRTLTIASTGAASGPITGSSLTMATGRLLGRSTAGTGAPEEFALGGALSFTGSSLLLTDAIKLRISNTGETATVANNHTETTVPRACTVIGATWELAPTSTGSTSSQAMLYARRSGVKTSLLSGNASIASGASFTDATGTLTGTLTLAAGDTLGVDLALVGTGSSGHIFTILVRYS